MYENNSYTIKNISIEEGLPCSEVTDIEIINDTIWVAAKEGLFSFSKKLLNTIDEPQEKWLHFNSITVNDEPIAIAQQSQFSHKENTVDFSFASIFFRQENSANYRYKLHEKDSIWQYTQNQSVRFTSLRPGNYDFTLQTQTEDKKWTPPIQYSFVILKPFWKSWWFVSAILLSIGLLIYLIFKYRLLIFDKRLANYIGQELLDRFKAIYYHEPKAIALNESINNYATAYKLMYNSFLNRRLNNYDKNNLVVSELNQQLRTAEKEKIIAEQENNILLEQANTREVEAKKRQTTTILGSTLLLGSIIAFLVYRNTKRKQRIAEQDRELQIQKTETILKEKEIETINAMVSGQEKERLRLASELHDNLGSTLATVRMQVENLERNLDKVDDPKALLQKTNALVNEAYTKVRSISHERNSGVLAKDGLLPAIQKLANTVSSNNDLQIEVQDFGLENRIANELEITIFRIIQELVTNIIKHAQATEVNISLTQHDNELNIMIEDNGKGFKVGKLKEKDGMGLGSIERRVEHLEGTMEVDSALGRGTSVSIDIPL